MKKVFTLGIIVFLSVSGRTAPDASRHEDLGHCFDGRPQSKRSFVGALKTLGMGSLGGGAGVTLMRISPSVRHRFQFSEHVALIGRNWAFYSKVSSKVGWAWPRHLSAKSPNFSEVGGKIGGEKLIHIGSVATGVVMGAMGATTAYLAFGNNPRYWGRRMLLASATSGVIWGVGSAIQAGARGAFIPGLVSGLIAGAAANTFTEFLDR